LDSDAKGELFVIQGVFKLIFERRKTVKKYLLTLFIISLAISACSVQSTEESSASLVGSWKLTSFGPVGASFPAVEGSDAELTFNEDGTMAGNSGCNGFGGSYTVEGDQVTFSEVVSTLIACEEPLMSQEQEVLQLLTGTATYQIEGNTLTLMNNDAVLVLTR
jgi:heat shock protein HslJ